MINYFEQNLKNFLKIREEISNLKFFGEDCLHNPSEKVIEIEESKIIIEELKEALLKFREITGLGRGIAAPQIGYNKKIFVTYVNDKFEVYINPAISKYSEELNLYKELCMSSGLMWADIERSESIVMSWLDENGKKLEKEFDSFMARLIQHEYDHLNGEVCLDKGVPKTYSFVRSNPLDEKLR